MAAYLVTYDLRNKATWGDYSELVDALKMMGAFKTQASVWLLQSTQGASSIFAQLRTHMDNDDFLYVAQLAQGGSWKSMSIKGTRDWMTKKVGPEAS